MVALGPRAPAARRSTGGSGTSAASSSRASPQRSARSRRPPVTFVLGLPRSACDLRAATAGSSALGRCREQLGLVALGDDRRARWPAGRASAAAGRSLSRRRLVAGLRFVGGLLILVVDHGGLLTGTTQRSDATQCPTYGRPCTHVPAKPLVPPGVRTWCVRRPQAPCCQRARLVAELAHSRSRPDHSLCQLTAARRCVIVCDASNAGHSDGRGDWASYATGGVQRRAARAGHGLLADGGLRGGAVRPLERITDRARPRISGPCASRVDAGADRSASSPPISRSATRIVLGSDGRGHVGRRSRSSTAPSGPASRRPRRPTQRRARASSVRMPCFIIRWTGTARRVQRADCHGGGQLRRARRPGTSIAPAAGLEPVGAGPACGPRRPRGRPGPGGSASSSSARRASGSQRRTTPISTYSASLAAPVGAAFA